MAKKKVKKAPPKKTAEPAKLKKGSRVVYAPHPGVGLGTVTGVERDGRLADVKWDVGTSNLVESTKLGLVDVDGEGKITATYGLARGRESEIQRALDEERLARKAAQAYKENRNTNPPLSEAAEQGEDDMAAKVEQKFIKKQNGKKVEPKAPKAKGEVPSTGPRAERRAQSIKVLNKESPHREGSKAEKFWNMVLKSKTVGDYLDAGGDNGYLAFYVKSEHIKLS